MQAGAPQGLGTGVQQQLGQIRRRAREEGVVPQGVGAGLGVTLLGCQGRMGRIGGVLAVSSSSSSSKQGHLSPLGVVVTGRARVQAGKKPGVTAAAAPGLGREPHRLPAPAQLLVLLLLLLLLLLGVQGGAGMEGAGDVGGRAGQEGGIGGHLQGVGVGRVAVG